MKYLYIGGAFNKYRFIIHMLISLKLKFPGFFITFYDSWKNSTWNGGRINAMYNRYHATLDTVRMYNRCGFGVGITFTNPQIDDFTLSDENELLETLNESKMNILPPSSARKHDALPGQSPPLRA